MANPVEMQYSVAVDWTGDGTFTTAGDDISSYVLEIPTVQFGIVDPIELVCAVGTCEITLNNDSRIFSPENTAGALYGKLVPNKEIIFSVTDGVSTYVKFRGFTRSFEPTSGEYGERQCKLRCTDILGKIQDEGIGIPLQTNIRSDVLLTHVVNAALHSPSAYNFAAVYSGNVADGNTITPGIVTGTFRTVLSTSGTDEILIGATPDASWVNAAAWVNKGDGAGTLYSTSATRNSEMSAQVFGSGTEGEFTSDTFDLIGNAGGNVIVQSQTFKITQRSLTVFTFDLDVNSGAPVGDMAWGLYTVGADGKPQAFGLPFKSGTITPTPSATNTITITDFPVEDTTTSYAMALSSVAAQALNTGWNWKMKTTGDFANGARVRSADGGSTWSVTGQDTKFTVFGAPTIKFTALLRGAIGNTYPLAKVGANISINGAALSNGADYPTTPAPSYAVGKQTFTVAADSWTPDATNGMTAIQQVVRSERGLFWIEAGVITYQNRDYIFQRASVAAALTLSSEHNALDNALSMDDVYNYVEVRYVPSTALTTGIVAQARSPIQVPGQSGTERWNGTITLPGGGSVVAKLPFTDPTTGQPMGASDLITPLVPGVGNDWTANEQSDGTGVDYSTPPLSNNLSFSLAINGGNVEVSIKNVALGPLYVTTLRPRGKGWVKYSPTIAMFEDETSQKAYGKRKFQLDLPMESGQLFASALASYTLSRYKDPRLRVRKIKFEKQTVVGGINLFSIQLGNVIVLTDAQTGITSQKYLVTGATLTGWGPSQTGDVEFDVRRLDDTDYGLWDTGKWDTAKWAI
jgi:hypothetical protein